MSSDFDEKGTVAITATCTLPKSTFREKFKIRANPCVGDPWATSRAHPSDGATWAPRPAVFAGIWALGLAATSKLLQFWLIVACGTARPRPTGPNSSTELPLMPTNLGILSGRHSSHRSSTGNLHPLTTTTAPPVNGKAGIHQHGEFQGPGHHHHLSTGNP